MIKEPLKDKVWCVRHEDESRSKRKEGKCHWVANEKDIKSAVEWYLEETRKPIFPEENKLYDEWVKSKPELNYAVWLVLKAFEDVTK